MCSPRSATPDVATASRCPDDRGDCLSRTQRMHDADTPLAIRSRSADALHVAAAVDAVVRRAGRFEPVADLLDRPALDVSGRVQSSGRVVIESAGGLGAEPLAGREHLANHRRAVDEFDLAAVEAADPAVVAVGGERGVHLDAASRSHRPAPCSGTPGARTSIENTVPMQCSTNRGVDAVISGRPGRARSAATGCSPRWCRSPRTRCRCWALCADIVSCTSMRRRLRVDLGRVLVERGELGKRDLGDLAAGDGDGDLHDAVLGLDGAPDEPPARRAATRTCVRRAGFAGCRAGRGAVPRRRVSRSAAATSAAAPTATPTGLLVALEIEQRHQTDDGAGDREKGTFHCTLRSEHERFGMDLASRHAEFAQPGAQASP